MPKTLFYLFFLIPFFTNGQVVVDNGEFFSDSELIQLQAKVDSLKSTNNVEVLIYTTDTLNGTSPVEYGMSLSSKFKVGDKGINNGIILLMSKKDRKVQLLNGYGIEWSIDDQLSGQFISQSIPYFKKNQFANGVIFLIDEIKKSTQNTTWNISYADDLSKNLLQEGQIIVFESYRNIIRHKLLFNCDINGQFSDLYSYEIKTKLGKFKILYSCHMKNLIYPNKDGYPPKIYARLTGKDLKTLELIGID